MLLTGYVIIVVTRIELKLVAPNLTDLGTLVIQLHSIKQREESQYRNGI
jgi:hypothetical protein